ncbi:MAG: sigma-54 dependent transcriptional regulator [Deltaproteobacteria bacterium]|nr:sigma-54 dependent transcriptional regulator [Deltaproteobacteria bacterium]
MVGSPHKEPLSTIGKALGSDYHVEGVQSFPQLLNRVRDAPPDYLFVDLDMLRGPDPGKRHGTGLDKIRGAGPTAEVIVMARNEKIREAVGLVKAGATDYVTYPLDPEEIKFVMNHIREHITIEAELDYLRDQFWEDHSLEFVQTKCPAMKTVYEMVRAVAPTRSTVLLMGKTGTGKGLLARVIHSHSNRKNNPFISVHCGAIPDTLVESELFGHEKGAFTGAVKRKLGRFEAAHGGTIFLDEISTLTPTAQIKLLQVLQDGTFERVGGEQSVQVDVRVVSATNTDLEQMGRDGLFRKDLFYRLNVFPINIPPLRNRIEDIPHLARLFLQRLEKQGQKGIRSIDPTVLQGFRRYSWPGNIREMENVIERAYILGNPPMLTSKDFPEDLLPYDDKPPEDTTDRPRSLAEARRRAGDAAEEAYLRRVLTQCRGRIKDAAQMAGVTPRQIHKLMTKHGLRKEAFKRSAGT